VFHIGSLVSPRFMAWGPDSVLLVADPGLQRIVALPDADGDGTADTAGAVTTAALGHSNVAYYDGALYADASNRIVKFTDEDGDGIFENRTNLITGLPSGGYHPLH